MRYQKVKSPSMGCLQIPYNTSTNLLRPQTIRTSLPFAVPMASSNCLFLLCLALLTAMAAATQFRVGGSMGWTAPTDPNAVSYNWWAERNRFQVGDSLLFVYPPDRDSVLQVTQDAYRTCNTSSYIRRFDDGSTVFTFNQSGTHYFISGDKGNCLGNESMVTIVMAARSNRDSPSGSNVALETAPSPPPNETLPLSPPLLPSPPPNETLPLSPPLPPPSPEEVPPPPAAEVTPSPAPAGEFSPPPPPPPPPNGASLKVVGFMSSAGALLGSLLVF